MSQDLDAWVKNLLPLNLPVLGSTQVALRALQRDANVSAARISTVVLADPMMTLRILRLVNARRGGSFAQRIATVEHCVMMLGLDATFGQLGKAAALEDELAAPAREGLLKTTARACHAALHAREWAVQRLDLNVEEVYIAALLREMGEMALWVSAPEVMAELQRARRKQPWSEAEQAMFGFTLDELSYALAENWNMPPLVESVLRPEDCEAHPRSRSVMLASHLARHAEMGWYGAEISADLDDIADTRHLLRDEVVVQVHRTAVESARRFSFAGVVPPAAWLPMLPGEWPDDEAKPAAVEIQAVDSAADVQIPNDPFQAVMEEIARHMDGTLTLHDLLVLVLKGMRDGIGLRRVVFALLTHDRSTLGAKYVVGAEEGSPLKAFRFDMSQRNIFSVLMAKPQAVWMAGENRAKYAAYLSAEVRAATSDHEFYAMSLGVHGKVIGLFYADCAGTGNRLDADGYDKFRKLCAQAALGMEHLAKAKPAGT